MRTSGGCDAAGHWFACGQSCCSGTQNNVAMGCTGHGGNAIWVV